MNDKGTPLNWCGLPILAGEGYGGKRESTPAWCPAVLGTKQFDARAERILSALQAAGDSGLTRTAILEDVCQRNWSASALTGALQSLRRCGLADYRKEATGGKPRERWFATSSEVERKPH